MDIASFGLTRFRYTILCLQLMQKKKKKRKKKFHGARSSSSSLTSGMSNSGSV